jgi:hypothetical protein
MEQSKTPWLDNIGKTFGGLTAQTDFASRYYEMCQQYPIISGKLFSCKKQEVVRVLSEIGQTPQRDGRDKSYSFDYNADGWEISRGCTLSHGLVEFWFFGTRGTEHFGGRLASSALGVRESIDPAKLPHPPFPRPCCHSYDDLREALRNCFQLCQVLFSVLERMPKQ